MADMQTVGGAVVADIGGDGAGDETRVERRQIGALVDEAALLGGSEKGGADFGMAALSTTNLRPALGLMSGTSLDGVDVAALATDGHERVVTGPALTVPYPDAFRERLRAILGSTRPSADIATVEAELTRRHAAAVAEFRARHPGVAIDLVGFHGHTILHRPAEHRTWQIGDGALLARLAGVDVVADFRSADVAAGGEGAPLAPLYHAALAAGRAKPVAVLNLGGVGNVTWIGPGLMAGPTTSSPSTPGRAMR